ncbi:MAG: adenylate/guanylate cyclase domain-containing protein [Alphaproteobacteria bacterium]
MKRRLTTVLCADVSSYTRLMEQDEAGTLDRLRACRQSMAGLIARHDGRVINTWGDALIAEFPSVLEAVHAAVEIQQELAARNRDLPETERMWFRIGINLGDVMVEGDDIYGEGVNIAARLQQSAEPGGILISRPVFDQVRNKLSFGFDYLGDQTVKNVSDPVPSYRIRFDGAPDADQPADGASGAPKIEPVLGPRATPAELWAAFRKLPALIRLSFVGVAFFFALNLASGLFPLWFHWPSIPMLAIILLYYSLRRPRDKSP